MGSKSQYHSAFEEAMVAMVKSVITSALLLVCITAFAQEKSIGDSTLSGYKADIPFVNPTNKDVEMAYQDQM